MVTKSQAIKVVNNNLNLCIKLLKLEKYKVNVHVLHTRSKFLAANGARPRGEMASCYGSEYGKSADIIIHYDKHPDKEEVLSSLIHELLHLKLGKLSELITLKQNKAYNIEEKLVRDFEDILMSLLGVNGKLLKKLKRLKHAS
jgi:hypothetical protein